jgi:drug/metabolite transporter (DMT)-like permease
MVMGAGLLWGTTGIIGKMVYSETAVGPIQLAWYRLIFAIPVLTAVSFAKHYRISLTRREFWLFAAFGFISLTVFEALYFTSFDYTTVQHAAALLYTAPAFVAILSWLILKERFSRNKILAVGLSISGAFLIMGILRGEPLFASRTQLGDWLGLGSGLAYSSWYIFGKVLGKNREPAVTSLIALCFGAVFLLPLMFGLEGLHPPNTLLAWELVGTIGIVPTAMAYIFYLGGLRLIDATKASVFAIVEPVSAAILAFLILGETLSYDSLIGFTLIISSILLISTTGS